MCAGRCASVQCAAPAQRKSVLTRNTATGQAATLYRGGDGHGGCDLSRPALPESDARAGARAGTPAARGPRPRRGTARVRPLVLRILVRIRIAQSRSGWRRSLVTGRLARSPGLRIVDRPPLHRLPNWISRKRTANRTRRRTGTSYRQEANQSRHRDLQTIVLGGDTFLQRRPSLRGAGERNRQRVAPDLRSPRHRAFLSPDGRALRRGSGPR